MATPAEATCSVCRRWKVEAQTLGGLPQFFRHKAYTPGSQNYDKLKRTRAHWCPSRFQDGVLLLPVSPRLQCPQTGWAHVPEELGRAHLPRAPPAGIPGIQVSRATSMSPRELTVPASSRVSPCRAPSSLPVPQCTSSRKLSWGPTLGSSHHSSHALRDLVILKCSNPVESALTQIPSVTHSGMNTGMCPAPRSGTTGASQRGPGSGCSHC